MEIMNPPIINLDDYLDALEIIRETNQRAVRNWNAWRRESLDPETPMHSTGDQVKDYIWNHSVESTKLLRGRDAEALILQCAEWEAQQDPEHAPTP